MKWVIVALFVIGGVFAWWRLGDKREEVVVREKVNMVSGEEPSVVPTLANSDKQAGFAIFTNGVFRVFTARMYHNRSSEVYIEANNPNVIQVRKLGITWQDFFSTLPFKLEKDCLLTGTGEKFCTGTVKSLQFFLNGEVVGGEVLGLEIKQGDRLLVSFDTRLEGARLQQQLDKVPNKFDE